MLYTWQHRVLIISGLGSIMYKSIPCLAIESIANFLFIPFEVEHASLCLTEHERI